MSENSRNRGLFVTGTDTGVGKTLVAAGLVKLAGDWGIRARAVKPIETGCPVRSGMLYPEDGAFLLQASDEDLTLDECVPFRFSLPASPLRAATMEDRRLRMADLVEHVLTVAQAAELTVVEGAGGLLVPLEERVMMIDLIECLAFPIILVARRGLGTLNHTLLSLEALQKRGMKPSGIVLSCTSARPGPEEEFTERDLTRLVDDIPIAVLPFLSADVRKDPSGIAETMANVWRSQTLKQWLGA